MSTKLSRRDFIKITAAAGGALLGGKLLFDLKDERTVTISETRLLMGTIINLTVVAESRPAGEQAAAATFAELERQIAIFDYRAAQSPLSILNRDGELANPRAELVEVLTQANAIAELTAGAFDVTVKPLADVYQQAQPALPGTDQIQSALELVDYRKLKISSGLVHFAHPNMAVTLDGIAKGYIVDAGTAKLRSLGFDNILVEAGGDLMASGMKESQSPWKVGVESPRKSESGILARFAVSNQAAATSGDYMHYYSADLVNHHILDPRAGHSPTELASATIISPNAAQSDALATAVMVLGIEQGLDVVEAISGVEAFLVTKELEQYRSSGLIVL